MELPLSASCIPAWTLPTNLIESSLGLLVDQTKTKTTLTPLVSNDPSVGSLAPKLASQLSQPSAKIRFSVFSFSFALIAFYHPHEQLGRHVRMSVLKGLRIPPVSVS